MARRAGRNGRIYLAITSSGTAEPIAFQTKWTLNLQQDKFDVTAYGDTTKTYVVGLPSGDATYNGFYDDTTAQMFTGAADGIARKVYLYTDVVNYPQSRYWFSTAFVDAQIEVPVDGAIPISGNITTATGWVSYGI